MRFPFDITRNVGIIQFGLGQTELVNLDNNQIESSNEQIRTDLGEIKRIA